MSQRATQSFSKVIGSILAEEIRRLVEERPITQAHVDASYAKVTAAHKRHAKFADAGYGKRTITPGDMEKKDAKIRQLQTAHQTAAVAHNALVKRFKAQKPMTEAEAHEPDDQCGRCGCKFRDHVPGGCKDHPRCKGFSNPIARKKR